MLEHVTPFLERLQATLQPVQLILEETPFWDALQPGPTLL